MDSQTITDTGDDETGGDTQTISGTDSYTLTESGSLTTGTINETVVGTDTYSGSQSGNDDKGTYSVSTSGGGAWTRTGTGATSGINSYTDTTTGNDYVGHYSESRTGTDRYGLVDRFDEASNAASGNDPGNVTFFSHGRMFQDGDPPPQNESWWWKRIKRNVAYSALGPAGPLLGALQRTLSRKLENRLSESLKA